MQYQVVQVGIKHYMYVSQKEVMPDTTRLYPAVQGCSGLYQLVSGITRLYRAVPRLYQAVLASSRQYQVVQAVLNSIRMYVQYQNVCTGQYSTNLL
jgi:hypothetical protein